MGKKTGDVGIIDVAKQAGVSVDAAQRALGILIGEPARLVVSVPSAVVRNAVSFLKQNCVRK
jgi:hypothetical protein